jgi:hypothetical protein
LESSHLFSKLIDCGVDINRIPSFIQRIKENLLAHFKSSKVNVPQTTRLPSTTGVSFTCRF